MSESNNFGLLELDGRTIKWQTWSAFEAEAGAQPVRRSGRVRKVDVNSLGAEVFPPDEIVGRAKAHVGTTGYRLLLWNCETFARWCATGVACSQQVAAVLPLLLYLCSFMGMFLGIEFYVSLESQAGVGDWQVCRAPWHMTFLIFIITAYLLDKHPASIVWSAKEVGRQFLDSPAVHRSARDESIHASVKQDSLQAIRGQETDRWVDDHILFITAFVSLIVVPIYLTAYRCMWIGIMPWLSSYLAGDELMTYLPVTARGVLRSLVRLLTSEVKHSGWVPMAKATYAFVRKLNPYAKAGVSWVLIAALLRCKSQPRVAGLAVCLAAAASYSYHTLWGPGWLLLHGLDVGVRTAIVSALRGSFLEGLLRMSSPIKPLYLIVAVSAGPLLALACYVDSTQASTGVQDLMRASSAWVTAHSIAAFQRVLEDNRRGSQARMVFRPKLLATLVDMATLATSAEAGLVVLVFIHPLTIFVLLKFYSAVIAAYFLAITTSPCVLISSATARLAGSLMGIPDADVRQRNVDSTSPIVFSNARGCGVLAGSQRLRILGQTGSFLGIGVMPTCGVSAKAQWSNGSSSHWALSRGWGNHSRNNTELSPRCTYSTPCNALPEIQLAINPTRAAAGIPDVLLPCAP